MVYDDSTPRPSQCSLLKAIVGFHLLLLRRLPCFYVWAIHLCVTILVQMPVNKDTLIKLTVKVVLLTTAIDEEFLELKHAGGLITSNPLFPGQFSRTVSNFSDLSVYSVDTVFLLAFPLLVQCLINTFTLIVRQLSP